MFMLHLPELLHDGGNRVILTNVVYSSNDNDLQPVAVLQDVLYQGSSKVPHPGPHYTLNFDMLCDLGQFGVIPDSIQSAVSQDNLPGGVAGLDCGLKLLAHWAHEVSLCPFASKSSQLHGGEVVVPYGGCIGGAVGAGLVPVLSLPCLL